MRTKHAREERRTVINSDNMYQIRWDITDTTGILFLFSFFFKKVNMKYIAVQTGWLWKLPKMSMQENIKDIKELKHIFLKDAKTCLMHYISNLKSCWSNRYIIAFIDNIAWIG